VDLYSAQIWITQCYLQTTPYLPLLPSRRASPPCDWYSLRLPTKEWPGWVDLGGWLNWDKSPAPELNRDTVTHPSTNRARRRVTSLIRPTSQPTAPNRHQYISMLSISCSFTQYLTRFHVWRQQLGWYPSPPVHNIRATVWRKRQKIIRTVASSTAVILKIHFHEQFLQAVHSSVLSYWNIQLWLD